MQKKLFIGVDFSKNKLDVTAMYGIEQKSFLQETFENEEKGYKSLLRWLSRGAKIKREDWQFCGEHTGLYSRGLSNFLFKKKLDMWLENPLQIKRSWGIKRIKNDRIDSLEIARYAMRFADRVVSYKPESKEIASLRLLFSYRNRLVKTRVALEVAAKEMRRVIWRDATSRFIFEDSHGEAERIKKRITALETKMHQLIMDSELRRSYLLVCSIKGVGMITAVALIIHTSNFASFESARQLACYCGCAPFANQSGMMDKGAHISSLANRELKVLLTQCARCAASHNAELRAYYRRKKAEGKKDSVVINNIRNKLVHRIFAVIKSGIPYSENYLYPLTEAA